MNKIKGVNMTEKQAKAIKFLEDKLFYSGNRISTIKGVRNLTRAEVESVIMKIEMDARGVAHELWGDEEKALYDKVMA